MQTDSPNSKRVKHKDAPRLRQTRRRPAETSNDNERAAKPKPAKALPDEGFVRISAILGPLGPIPVSKSTWWAGVKSGRFPPPIKLGRGITVWRVEDIRALISGSP
jgi:predicted DNA-binding transcriptional regulator AlpA